MESISLNKSGDKYLNINNAFLGVYKKSAFSMKKFQYFYGGRASLKTSRHSSRIIVDLLLIPNTISYAIAKSSENLETGLHAEFLKVIDRLTDGTLEEGIGKDYRVIKKPLQIQFSNGSVVYFKGSQNIEQLKGRTVPSSKHRFGHILLDEFADYSNKKEVLDIIVGTFVRKSGTDDYRHYIWDDKELDLDRVATDDNGDVIYDEDMYGTLLPRIIPGTQTKNCIIMISYNPPKNKYDEVFEIQEEYEQRKDTLAMKVNYTHVKKELISIGQLGIITEAEQMKLINPQKYEHVWEGNPTGTDGLFFDTFKPQNSRQSLSETLGKTYKKTGVGVDFGVSNATSFVYGGIDSLGELNIINTYCHSNKMVREEDQKGAEEYVKDLFEFIKKTKKQLNETKATPVFYDPSAKVFKLAVDSYLRKNPRDRKVLKMYKADNNRVNTLEIMKDYITTKRFHYATEGHYLMMESEIARAQESKNGDDIVKENDHVIDAIRYLAYKLYRLTRRY